MFIDQAFVSQYSSDLGNSAVAWGSRGSPRTCSPREIVWKYKSQEFI